jgi:hypothetical protein
MLDVVMRSISPLARVMTVVVMVSTTPSSCKICLVRVFPFSARESVCKLWDGDRPSLDATTLFLLLFFGEDTDIGLGGNTEDALGRTPRTNSSPNSSWKTLRNTSYGSLNLNPFNELCFDIFKEPFLRVLVPFLNLVLGLSHGTLSSVVFQSLALNGGGATPTHLFGVFVLGDAPGLGEYEHGLVPLGLGLVDSRDDILGLNDEKEDDLLPLVELELEGTLAG